MNEKNRLSIEVDHEDHIFVESVCSQGHYSFYTFFKHCLALYRRSLNEPMHTQDHKICAPEQAEIASDDKLDDKKHEAKKFRKK